MIASSPTRLLPADARNSFEKHRLAVPKQGTVFLITKKVVIYEEAHFGSGIDGHVNADE